VEANTRILEVEPHNTAALNRRAKCYREQKDFLAAEVDYHRALELGLENANIQNALKEIREEARKQRADEEYIEKLRTIRTFDEVYAIAKVHKSKSPSKRRIAVEAFKRAFLLDREDRCAD
jgi:tetratricopeptide (TPR) repeat protein